MQSLSHYGCLRLWELNPICILTFHFIVGYGCRSRKKITVYFLEAIENQGIASTVGHHLPCRGERSVVISKGKLRIILI